MKTCRPKKPGTSFEASWTPRARAPGRRRVLQGPFGRLQEALSGFQRVLGRLAVVWGGVGGILRRLFGRLSGHVWEVFEWMLRSFYIVLGEGFRG